MVLLLGFPIVFLVRLCYNRDRLFTKKNKEYMNHANEKDEIKWIKNTKWYSGWLVADGWSWVG